MKFKSALSILASLVMVGCVDTTSYTVRCQLSDSSLDGAMLYLSSYQEGTRQRQRTDSAVVENGEICFTGNIEGTAIRRFEAGSQRVNFILEHGEIFIDLNSESAYGTPLNVEMSAYIIESDSLRDSFASRYDEVSHDSTLARDEKSEKLSLMLNDFCYITLNKAREIVARNRDNAFGQYVFWMDIAYNDGITPDIYRKELTAAGEYIANYGPIVRITNRFDALERTAVGTQFVDFAIEHGAADSTVVKLSDYAGNGKLLLVGLWASWCAPCRDEMPHFKAVYEKYAGEHFDVLSIAVWDRRDETIHAIDDMSMTWNQILSADNIPTELYGVNGIPHAMLISPDGTILARGLQGDAIELWVSQELAKIDE